MEVVDEGNGLVFTPSDEQFQHELDQMFESFVDTVSQTTALPATTALGADQLGGQPLTPMTIYCAI